MQKIPTLFVRDPDDRKHVLDEVTPGCEWVLADEGVATRKHDGTCMRITHNYDLLVVSARREVKADREAPSYFEPVSTDPVTGKTMGWVPVSQSGFEKFVVEALGYGDPLDWRTADWPEGTYELVGPKINGNPERRDQHELIRHGSVLLDIDDEMRSERTFEAYARLMRRLDQYGIEGIVWHHPDGRMVKLKARDFA